MWSDRSSSHGRRFAHVIRVLLIGALAGTLGCSGAAGATGTPSSGATGPAAAGRLIDARDADGRQYREVPERQAPEADLVVSPDPRSGWDLHLTLHRFRLTPAQQGARTAVAGRGRVELSLDGRRLAVLHAPRYHLPAHLLSRGTHQLTARLYADDGTVWAVHGEPVESTAALTASEPTAGTSGGPSRGPSGSPAREPSERAAVRPAALTPHREPGAVSGAAGGAA